MPTLDRAVGANANFGFAEPLDSNFYTLSNFGFVAIGNGGDTDGAAHVWARFANMTIAAGSTIDVAYITFANAGVNDSGTLNMVIRGVDEDDHAAPTTFATWNTDHGLHTTATVQWDRATAAAAMQSPSLVAIIQELVDRAGWASGNDMGIHVDDDGTTSAAQLWNNATLHVEWTEGGTTHQATAAASITVTGAAAGKAVRSRTATTSITVTGSATGHAVRKATASASITVTATATGQSQPRRATGTTTVSVTTAATGRAIRHATGATTVAVTAAATARAIRRATAAAAVAVTGSATGLSISPPKQATAAATVTVTITATGWRKREHATGTSLLEPTTPYSKLEVTS